MGRLRPAFPHKLAADTLSWQDLVAAARVVHHTIGGRSPGEVIDALRADIRAHSASSPVPGQPS